ncbi:rna demethylase alkbh5 [Phtheirospermum japonicum]|uniref:Rna demethylase alkbh5 n=1 Tax=Phtheirospermum japonicum TaxID=374723 RepID=A0A830BMR3_9LAMI|nr:rna demethylase alkbh5 [Phtheirospermum japonicum]
MDDPFLVNYDDVEVGIAAEFLSNWLPFLSRGLCKSCTQTLSDGIRSLHTGALLSTKDCGDNNDCGADTHSLGSWKDEADELYEHAVEASPTSETFSSSAPLASSLSKKSWADMALEDELAAEEDFICLERVNGKLVNIMDGLELHKGVFSAAEQKRIVGYVEQLQEMGRNGQLKERTYSAPQKWMRGKGRVTLQFGCCYNYATDKNGNPPGILRNEMVDPLPHLFKVMIKRLVRWCVLPPSCVPDSCIVNIYEEGDCIPPHIDNHDFVRPFCTVSFFSECAILFGSNLKILGAGEFAGSYAIPLPVGSVLVINGNGADVAKHCVPAVPSRRISITFRRMDESKWPSGYVPEPDLQGLQPLSDNVDRTKKYNSSSRARRFMRNPAVGREDRVDRGRGSSAKNPDPHYSGRIVQGPVDRRRISRVI